MFLHFAVMISRSFFFPQEPTGVRCDFFLLLLWAVPPGNISTPGWSCVFFSRTYGVFDFFYTFYRLIQRVYHTLLCAPAFFDQIAS